jgi:hypothetical protein
MKAVESSVRFWLVRRSFCWSGMARAGYTAPAATRTRLATTARIEKARAVRWLVLEAVAQGAVKAIMTTTAAAIASRVQLASENWSGMFCWCVHEMNSRRLAAMAMTNAPITMASRARCWVEVWWCQMRVPASISARRRKRVRTPVNQASTSATATSVNGTMAMKPLRRWRISSSWVRYHDWTTMNAVTISSEAPVKLEKSFTLRDWATASRWVAK